MDGLYSFDQSSELFTPYLYDPENPNSISGNYITAIYEDKNNNLWFGTYYVRKSRAIDFDRSGLLNRFDKKTNQFTRYERNEDPYYLSYVSSICEDQTGRLWFGANENHGLYRYEENSNQFIRYGYYQNNPKSISSNIVSDLYVDNSGILWIATNNGGVNKYDPNKEKFTHFEHVPGKENTLRSNNVTRIIEDSFGKVWIGTWGKKTTVYDPVTGLFDKYNYVLYYKKPKTDPKHLSWPWVKDILEDKLKNIWIGTVIGLNKYDADTKTYKKYFNNPGKPSDPNYLCDYSVICMLQDREEYLWLGTGNGLSRMNIKEESFKHYFHIPADSNSISSNKIDCLFEDKSGDLWFGSFGNGINLYNRSKDQFKWNLHNLSNMDLHFSHSG